MAQPLCDLLIIPLNGIKRVVAKSLIRWGKKYQITPEKLISVVTISPVLFFLDFSTDFKLHVDTLRLRPSKYKKVWCRKLCSRRKMLSQFQIGVPRTKIGSVWSL